MSPPSQSSQTSQTTIGVFDSGFGGLTVLRALLPLIPSARYVYLGDTARLPYGSKSRDTIARYAVSSARFLLEQGAGLLVIACNTATALALEDIRTAALPIPVLGVIEPGVQAAAAAAAASASQVEVVIPSGAKNPSILPEPPPPHASPQPPASSHPPHTHPRAAQVLVLATAATVQSHAYAQALARLGIAATEKACPLLVPLVEEGWIDHPVTRQVARIYLSEALRESPSLTTLLLGCTHYPLLRPLLEQTLADLGHPLRIIDSAQATAHTVAACLEPGSEAASPPPACTFYATDSIEKFQQLGSHFLGQPLPEVHLVDLGG